MEKTRHHHEREGVGNRATAIPAYVAVVRGRRGGVATKLGPEEATHGRGGGGARNPAAMDRARIRLYRHSPPELCRRHRFSWWREALPPRGAGVGRGEAAAATPPPLRMGRAAREALVRTVIK
ncbi:hypothetical protein PR202_gb12763 [Eleusine coracana subsp. coracana]|uniref:Uncharacterized protein n=1 Tax=Eleusine coracana subsp. coracana TaxID=191504 RepID=A0AAV5ERE5_ELECO|nr:hypothetical protein PR202_gb12763 [Eleusine coracana subsp. coracana]